MLGQVSKGNDELFASEPVDRIAGADAHLCESSWNLDAAEFAGERLLAHVRMAENPGREHAAVRREDLPGIREMIPACVVMANRDDKVADGRGAFRRGRNDVCRAGEGVTGSEQDHERCGGKQSRPLRPAASLRARYDRRMPPDQQGSRQDESLGGCFGV